MRLPGWLKVVAEKRSAGGYEVILRIRWWHPGAWWELGKELLLGRRSPRRHQKNIAPPV
jgi:hypothetical protein